MLNAVYCEFSKFKKFLLVIFPVLMLPLFNVLEFVGRPEPLNWHSYMKRIELSNFFFIFTFIFLLITAYIFTCEISYNTTSTLYSYPISRIKIFLSKLIFIILIIVVGYTLHFIISILSGLMISHEELTIGIVLIHLKIFFHSLIFQIALVPFTIFIALLSKNMIVPSVYGVSIMIINVFAMNINEAYVEYFPTILPASPILKCFSTLNTISVDMIIMSNQSMLTGIVTFAVGITACIMYYLKADIY